MTYIHHETFSSPEADENENERTPRNAQWNMREGIRPLFLYRKPHVNLNRPAELVNHLCGKSA